MKRVGPDMMCFMRSSKDDAARENKTMNAGSPLLDAEVRVTTAVPLWRDCIGLGVA